MKSIFQANLKKHTQTYQIYSYNLQSLTGTDHLVMSGKFRINVKCVRLFAHALYNDS